MEPLFFKHQQEFHQWLLENHEHHGGIWLTFDKTKTSSSLTAEEALDEALCFGWIDGQLKRIDESFYVKYFTRRTPKSIWSTKNKASAERLIKAKKMMPSGYHAIDAAKKDGRWETSDMNPTDYSISDFILLIKKDDLALEHYLKMSPSIQKTYALSYYVLKKDESRQRRLDNIIKRLRDNLKPM